MAEKLFEISNNPYYNAHSLNKILRRSLSNSDIVLFMQDNTILRSILYLAFGTKDIDINLNDIKDLMSIEEWYNECQQLIHAEANTNITKKRTDYISWDEYFMGITLLSAKRSKDPSTQVGACIVSPDNRIISVGYNGFPNGCNDDIFPWTKEGDIYNTKYAYVAHAELNAILNARGSDLNNATLYVALFPCNECAKAIIQSGIQHIVFACDKYADTPEVMASKRMLDAAGVTYDLYEYSGKIIELNV